MSTDPRIEAAAKAIYDIRDDEFSDDEWADLDSADRELHLCQARAALAAIDKAATITTVEGLGALPNESVIIDDGGMVYEKDSLVRDPSVWWWLSTGERGQHDPDEPDFPARVIHWGTK